MWKPRRLTDLQTSTACYRGSFTFFTSVYSRTSVSEGEWSAAFFEGLLHPQIKRVQCPQCYSEEWGDENIPKSLAENRTSFNLDTWNMRNNRTFRSQRIKHKLQVICSTCLVTEKRISKFQKKKSFIYISRVILHRI
jgi:hypothetical protein